MATATARIKLDGSQFEAAGKRAVGSFKSMASGVLQVAGGIAVYNLAVKAATSATNLFKSAIQQAADMEDMELGFETLLGSAAAAEERMRELADFAASTPFELPQVAQASRTLEVLTEGALATGDGLRLVGDVAAGAQRPFSELATWIGRLYDGLQSGRPVGEAMARLQELGVISGKTRARLEDLADAGKTTEAWDAAQQAMARFSGDMEKKSQGWNGLMSTLKDNVAEAMRSFGKPFIEQFKPALKGAIEMAKKFVPIAEKFGKLMAGGIIRTIKIIKEGRMGELISAVVGLAFNEGINVFIGGIKTALAILGAGARAIFSADFGSAIVNIFVGVGLKLQAILLNAFASPIAWLQAHIIKAIGKISEWLDDGKFLLAQGKFLRNDKKAAKAFDKGDKEKAQEFRDKANEGMNEMMAIQERRRMRDDGRTVNDIKNELLEEGVQFGIFEAKTANELNAEADERLKEAGQDLKDPLETFLKDAGVALKGFQKSDMISTEGQRAKLKELFEGAFKLEADEKKRAAAKDGGAAGFGGAIGGGKFEPFAASSLARVGGGGGIDNSAKMAVMAKRQLAVQQDMLQELKKMNGEKGGLQ